MPDNHPAEQPGHLDIDAVSAYVDRDFAEAELTTIEVHLAQCPACEREVLEIKTTVFLLGGLPQYEPRRSFCLGEEHARAARRRERTPAIPALSPALPASHTPATPASAPVRGFPAGGWMPVMHVAALVTGVLLLLVTVGELSGLLGDEPSSMQLAAPTVQPTALAETPAPPLAAMPAARSAQIPPMAAVRPNDGAAQEPLPEGISAFQGSTSEADGTDGADGASDQIPEGEELAQTSPRLLATTVAAASVTQAIPTPGAANAADGGTARGAADAALAANDGEPSRLRIVQLALALILAWLVVSIAGARWIRRLR